MTKAEGVIAQKVRRIRGALTRVSEALDDMPSDVIDEVSFLVEDLDELLNEGWVEEISDKGRRRIR